MVLYVYGKIIPYNERRKHMKQKITVTIERVYLEKAKENAKAENRNLSNYIESLIYSDLMCKEMSGKSTPELIKAIHQQKVTEYYKAKAQEVEE